MNILCSSSPFKVTHTISHTVVKIIKKNPLQNGDMYKSTPFNSLISISYFDVFKTKLNFVEM